MNPVWSRRIEFGCCALAALWLIGHGGSAEEEPRPQVAREPTGGSASATEPTPAIRELQSLQRIVFLRPSRRFFRSDAAIAGVMEKWLELTTYPQLQEVLRRTHARRMVGWTASGFDLEHFSSVWVVEGADRTILLARADHDALCVLRLSPDVRRRLSADELETVAEFQKVVQDFADRSRIEGRENQLGGTVTVLTVLCDGNERFVYSFGFLNEDEWDPLFRARGAMAETVHAAISRPFADAR